MKRIDWIHGSLAALTLVIATLAMSWGKRPPRSGAFKSDEPKGQHGASASASADFIVDASGRKVAVKPYRRIVAGSIVARSVLAQLVDPSEVVGVLDYGLEDSESADFYRDAHALASMKSTEELIALRPDLIVVNAETSLAHRPALERSGSAVFILGDMKGATTFARDLRAIGALVKNEDRAERLARNFLRRLQQVAVDIPLNERKRGMYLSAYANQFFGGTAGTSYADLLAYGGLVDIAANRFRGWPELSAEDILALDPPFIVSPKGVRQRVCSHGILNTLLACRNEGAGFVEIEGSRLEDPSFVMLEVAEDIRDAVYGAPL